MVSFGCIFAHRKHLYIVRRVSSSRIYSIYAKLIGMPSLAFHVSGFPHKLNELIYRKGEGVLAASRIVFEIRKGVAYRMALLV